MRTFILLSFIVGCVGMLTGGVHMIGEYPRTSTHSVGEDTFEMILRVALLAWTAFLLWGQ